jgi:hypothetical protein
MELFEQQASGLLGANVWSLVSFTSVSPAAKLEGGYLTKTNQKSNQIKFNLSHTHG